MIRFASHFPVRLFLVPSLSCSRTVLCWSPWWRKSFENVRLLLLIIPKKSHISPSMRVFFPPTFSTRHFYTFSYFATLSHPLIHISAVSLEEDERLLFLFLHRHHGSHWIPTGYTNNPPLHPSTPPSPIPLTPSTHTLPQHSPNTLFLTTSIPHYLYPYPSPPQDRL